MSVLGSQPARRRTVLWTLAAGGAAAGVASATAAGAGHRPIPAMANWLIGGTHRSVTHVDRVHSAARGREVDLVMTLPGGTRASGLPVCLLLHGLGGDARSMRTFGLAANLANETAGGDIAPFAFVAVDGGDNYWTGVRPGDDPMAMLLDEVPGWLRERDLGGPDGLPFGCAGVSMGGFGALLYARRRAEIGLPPGVIAAVSPALITSWQTMATRGIFPGRSAWASVDPLRHSASVGDARIGIWCGTDDTFIGGVRRFIRTAEPEVVELRPGGHVGFLRKVADDVVRFVGSRVPDDDVAAEQAAGPADR